MPDFLRATRDRRRWLGEVFYDLFDIVAYEFLYLASASRRDLFFNSGYLPVDAEFCPGGRYTAEAHCAMMYHFVARSHPGRPDPAPRRILDVGCGQGGGVLYLCTLYPGAAVTGTDRSAAAILRARRNLAGERRAHFVRTPTGGSGFVGRGYDMIIGVGTPTYIGLSRFIEQAGSHLAPGGIVSISGGYRHGDHAAIRSEIAQAAEREGLVLSSYRDIAEHTFAALQADIPRRERELRRVAWPLRGLARRWVDMPGSPEYQEYVEGRRADFAAVLHRRS